MFEIGEWVIEHYFPIIDQANDDVEKQRYCGPLYPSIGNRVHGDSLRIKSGARVI